MTTGDVAEQRRDTARAPGDVEFGGTETAADRPWEDVDASLSAFVDAYGTEEEREEAGEVSSLSGETRSAIAARTVLGNGQAADAEGLISVPVVNPATDNLNEGGLNAAAAAAGGARGADLPDADGVRSTVGTLRSRHFEESGGQQEEADVDEEEERRRSSSGERVLSEAFPEGQILEQATVNRRENRIEDVALLGRLSANNRVYTDQALRDAARLYRGARFFLDHPTESEMKEREGVRSVKDLAGRVANPRVVGDQVRGDLELLEREPTQSLVFALAEQMPQLVGNSHRARGTVKVDEDGTEIVEGLDQVFAVELVTEPATVGGLRESLDLNEDDGEETMDPQDLTAETLRQERPDLVEALVEDETLREERDDLRERVEELEEAAERAEELDAQLEDVTEERDDLQERVDELEAQEARREREDVLRELFQEAGLSREDVPDPLIRALLREEDEEEVREAVEEFAATLGDRREDRSSRPKLYERDADEKLKEADGGGYKEVTDADLEEASERLFA